MAFSSTLVDHTFSVEASWKRDKSLISMYDFVIKTHHEVNLLANPSGGDLNKYAFKVFSQLFTREEMAAGILEPAREKSNREGSA